MTGLPTIEIRFPATYAWIAIVFGVVFFFTGFLVAGQNTALGLLISALALAAIIGGNYWRRHLHVVARLTPRQIILRRGGKVDWTEIAAIDKKTFRPSYKGVRQQADYACIKLTKRRPTEPGLAGFLDKVKFAALGGYDIIVPHHDLSCTVDWFIAECNKRRSGTDQPL